MVQRPFPLESSRVQFLDAVKHPPHVLFFVGISQNLIISHHLQLLSPIVGYKPLANLSIDFYPVIDLSNFFLHVSLCGQVSLGFSFGSMDSIGLIVMSVYYPLYSVDGLTNFNIVCIFSLFSQPLWYFFLFIC